MRVRRGVIAAVAAAVWLAAAGPARAGSYDVVSCGAPGAGAVNLAWVPEAGGFPPSNIPPDPGSYRITDRCPGGLWIETAPPPGNAPFLTSGNWVFHAPPGTRLTRLETWRFGVKLRTGRDTPDPEGDTWRIFARDEGAQIIGGVFGETCSTRQGDIGCQFGSDTGVGAQSRAVYPINVERIAYAISCEHLGGCPRYFDDGTNRFSIATIKLFGTRVTVSDDSRPSLTAGGPLLAEGWRRPNDLVSYDASDNVGIRAGRLELAGRVARAPLPCDFRRRVPCANARGAAVGVPAGVPDGQHAARVVVEDAAGNETAVERQVRLDGTPPAVSLERARRRTIVIGLSDPASGVANVALEVRNLASEPFRALAGRISRGRLIARMDRGSAARADLRLTITDAAGNVARGNPTRLSVSGVRRGRTTARFGRGRRLRGRLTRSNGVPIAGQVVSLTAAVRRRGATSQPAGSGTTDRRGRFSIRVPAGPSRTLRLVFGGAGDALPAARGVSLRVPASSTIRASRTRLFGPGRVSFSGRLRTAGQRIPGRGLVLTLQGRERGRWRTFADTRAGRDGRWRTSYRFSGRPGSYPVRARIRRQAGFPFELGHSRPVVVRVG